MTANPLDCRRIEISWERMLELILSIPIKYRYKPYIITTETELNDTFANGRTSYSVYKKDLSSEEIDKLNSIGIRWEDDELVCLVCKKETYPGIYSMGEF